MSHRRRPFAALAIVVSLLLAGAPVTAALPDRNAAAPAVSERLLAWLGGWGSVVGRVFEADDAPPPTDLDLVSVPTANPQSMVQSSPAENEAGPEVDPDG